MALGQCLGAGGELHVSDAQHGAPWGVWVCPCCTLWELGPNCLHCWSWVQWQGLQRATLSPCPMDWELLPTALLWLQGMICRMVLSWVVCC